MEAKAYLAVFAKIQKIYEDTGAGKFLAFPLNNIYSFTPKNLSPLLGNGSADAALSLEKTAEFSRIINTPVKGMFFPSAGHETYLWDLYDEILATADIAESNKSESEHKEYKKACEFLFVKDEWEHRTNSESYNAYCDYKDRFYALTEELINLRTNNSTPINDSKLKQKKAEIDLLEAEWSSRGNRAKVELYLSIVKNFETSCPSVSWKEIKSGFDKDISLQRSLSNSDFAPTYLYPFDVLGKNWCTIHIGADEIESLCRSASQELRSRYEFDSGTEEIDSISFEYRSVLIERPWFNDSVFKSRLWRLPSHSNHEAISYGPDSFAGRFPAYVCALLLSRNFIITYKSGRKEMTFPENDTCQNDIVSVLSYICKHFPACPNPDPKATWLTESKTALLNIQQVPGGTIIAKDGGNEIGNGQVPVGDKIEFKALAKPGFILASWSINGTKHPNQDYAYDCIMPEEGLRVVPYWEQSESEDGIETVISGSTLVSLSGAPLHLDMNKYARLHSITTIAANAFQDSPDLCSIIIGNKVSSIGENAFSRCHKLESITIPRTTQYIAKGAFSRDNILHDPIITVDPENEMYATINGILEEKSKISKIKIIHCKCRSAYFYDKRAPEYCPKCGSRLSLNNEVVEDVRTPDSKIIFKINRDAAVHALTNYVSKKKFVSKDFIAAIKESELDLKPVYVPCWEWTIQANGQFKVVFSTPQKTDEKDEKGNNIIRQVEHESVQNASFPEKTILVSSSRIIDSKVVEVGNRISEVFSFENCPSATAFELYSKNKKESLQDARNSVISDLEKEATKRHGDEIYVRTSEKKVDFVKESCTLVMSPVWNGTFNYNDKTYPFYVDGYTGSVHAMKMMPKNWKLIGIIAGSIVVAIATIVLLSIF